MMAYGRRASKGTGILAVVALVRQFRFGHPSEGKIREVRTVRLSLDVVDVKPRLHQLLRNEMWCHRADYQNGIALPGGELRRLREGVVEGSEGDATCAFMISCASNHASTFTSHAQESSAIFTIYMSQKSQANIASCKPKYARQTSFSFSTLWTHEEHNDQGAGEGCRCQHKILNDS
jgi:hypothetical protein